VPLRALTATAIATSVLLGTAGCGLFVPSATLQQYSASDGLNVTVGDLKLRNVLIITDASGDASMVATIVNPTVNVQYVTAEFRGETPVDLTLVANEGLTKIGLADGNPAIIRGLGLAAGQYIDIYFQYGGQDGVTLAVPVLDGSDPIYAPYAPSLFTPEPTPAPTATPDPTETPAG
jgi:hypothetical protein